MPYNPYADWLYRLYLLATITGVAGGLIGIIILIVQTRATVKAARAAKVAADSAKESTEYIKNSERPWIIVTLQWAPGRGSLTHGQGFEHGVKYYFFIAPLRIECANHGKTPAWIVEQRLGLLVADEFPTNLPAAPIVKGRGEPVGSEPSVFDIAAEWRGADDPVGKLFAHGAIKYSDMFAGTRTTHFVYEIDMMNNRLLRHNHYHE